MAYLILDLDETVMQARGSKTFVNPCHLSQKSFIWRQSITGCDIRDPKLSDIINVKLDILNPDQLSQLISIAINQHDGIIILTSGLWSSGILEPLAEQLELAPHIKQRFVKSLFFSPVIEEQYWKGIHTIKDIRHELTKNDRLNQIINHPEHITTLGRSYFVLLDNDRRHVDSFKENPRATAIHATTDSEDNSFYFLTLRELELKRQSEEKEVLSETKGQDTPLKSPRLRGSSFANQGRASSMMTKLSECVEEEIAACCSVPRPKEQPFKFRKLAQRFSLFRYLDKDSEKSGEKSPSLACCHRQTRQQ